MNYSQVIKSLKSRENQENIAGMARFGINTKNTLGVSIPVIRKLAKEIGKDHSLAVALWNSDIHEARILACLVADPDKLTKSQQEKWVSGFDSWDVCDQCCMNLFDKMSNAYAIAIKWSGREEEFVKRAGFTLMASLALHDKKAKDNKFEQFFPYIIKGSIDNRNFVKKAVNWALRQIGKRSLYLNKKALKLAKRIEKIDSKASRWIARDAIRELTNEKILERMHSKNTHS